MKYQDDRTWADTYLPTITAILKSNAMHLVKVEIAPPEQDTKEATDMVISVIGGKVAVRIRRDNCPYRDLTLRACRRSNAKTELEKIRAGFSTWYFYAWTKTGQISEWMLLDCDKMRKTVLQKIYPLRLNTDGETGFIAIPRNDLAKAGCIIAEQR